MKGDEWKGAKASRWLRPNPLTRAHVSTRTNVSENPYKDQMNAYSIGECVMSELVEYVSGGGPIGFGWRACLGDMSVVAPDESGARRAMAARLGYLLTELSPLLAQTDSTPPVAIAGTRLTFTESSVGCATTGHPGGYGFVTASSTQPDRIWSHEDPFYPYDCAGVAITDMGLLELSGPKYRPRSI